MAGLRKRKRGATRRPELSSPPARARYRRGSVRQEGKGALLASPSYLAALLVHALALLVLSLWTIAAYVRDQNLPITAKLGVSAEVELEDPADEQRIDAMIQQVESELDAAVEVDTDAFYEEAFGETLGADSGERLAGLTGGGGLGRGGDGYRAGLLRTLRGTLGSDDLIVVAGAYDRVQSVLDVLELPHRTISFENFGNLDLDPGRQLLIVNCHSRPFDEAGRSKVRRFVEQGGYVFSSDWALRMLLEHTFAEAIKNRGETRGSVTTPISAPAKAADDPLLASVFPLSTRALTWQVDGMSDIVGKTRYINVLVEAPALKHCQIVACTFAYDPAGPVLPDAVEPGHGRVLHVLSHFMHQRDAAGDGFALQQLLLNFVLDKVKARRASGELPGASGLEARLDRAAEALEEAREQGPQAIRPVRAELRELLEELAGAPAERRDAALIAHVKGLLVEAAFLDGDHEQVALAIGDYKASLPRGSRPSQRALHAARLSQHALLIRQVARSLAPQASMDTKRAARRTLEGHVNQLRSERSAKGAGPLSAEFDRLLAEAAELAQRLAFGHDPESAIADGLRRYRAQPAQGEVSQGEWRLGVALLERAAGHYQSVTTRSPEGFALAERDEQAVQRRDLEARLDPRRREALGGLREQLRALRISALVALKRDEQALEELEAFEVAYPDSAHAEALSAFERVALARRLDQGLTSPDQRERLAELYHVLLARGTAPRGLEALAMAERLLRCDAAEDGRLLLEKALAGELPPPAELRARLHLIRLALASGQTSQAQLHLESLPASAAQRLDVRRARCAVLRQQGRAEQALEEYLLIVRALADDRPPEFWQVAEQTARTYLELGLKQAAKAFLENLRRLEPSLGGDGPQKDRIVDLMRELDRG